MPDLTSAGPAVPMLELTAVAWLLAQLAGGHMTLGEAEDYAGRASCVARAQLAAAPAAGLLPGEEPFPMPAARS